MSVFSFFTLWVLFYCLDIQKFVSKEWKGQCKQNKNQEKECSNKRTGFRYDYDCMSQWKMMLKRTKRITIISVWSFEEIMDYFSSLLSLCIVAILNCGEFKGIYICADSGWIIGGSPVRQGDFDFQVGLLDFRGGRGFNIFCTGIKD